MKTESTFPKNLKLPSGRQAFLDAEREHEKAILELRAKLAMEEDPETRDTLVRALDKRLRDQTALNYPI